jgi:hypothetical protein
MDAVVGGRRPADVVTVVQNFVTRFRKFSSVRGYLTRMGARLGWLETDFEEFSFIFLVSLRCWVFT